MKAILTTLVFSETIDPYKRNDKCEQDPTVNYANYKLKQLGFVEGIVHKLRSHSKVGFYHP
jgi:hypothetical protein